jgi:hypothetical protein
LRQPVRDGEGRLIGFTDETSDGFVVRDREGRYLGRTSVNFSTTRDRNGRLISKNSSDPGLLIGGDDE